MKKLNLIPIIATALVVFFTGCKKDDFEPGEYLCPEVISTIPIDQATDVPLNQMISATFSDEMDSATINQESFIIQQGETSITKAVPYSGVT
ncbi:MAG: Ig-like domain-containing protein, partial [Bacteroidota bacterium]